MVSSSTADPSSPNTANNNACPKSSGATTMTNDNNNNSNGSPTTSTQTQTLPDDPKGSSNSSEHNVKNSAEKENQDLVQILTKPATAPLLLLAQQGNAAATKMSRSSAADEAAPPQQEDEQMLDAATENNNDQQQGSSSRRSKRRSSVSRTSSSGGGNGGSGTPAKKKAKGSLEQQQQPKSSKPSKKEQDLLDQAWICVACKEAECAMDPTAEQFLVCEGPCGRLFHVPCAGLAQVPPEDAIWKCHDCLHEKHVCGFCQEYGQDNTDVFKCQKPQCGMFFHESCLQMQNIPIKQESDGTDNTAPSPKTAKEDSKEATASPERPKVLKFTCPSHWCWSCTQEDLKSEANAQEDAATSSAKKKPKGRRGSKVRNNAFASKKEARLFQCLECPKSYHVTCIPPSAKFHELALLCHEHAEKHELPALDLEGSLQGSVEAAADKKLHKAQNHDNLLAKRQQAFRSRFVSRNQFFPAGVVADRRTAAEQAFLSKVAAKGLDLANSEDESKVATSISTNHIIASGSETDRLLFCLPCDLQEEVYSKPPPYKHIHSLKYYPDNRPKKTPISNDVCSCVDSCGENCYNRLMYTECFGSNETANGSQGRGTNCRVGANCGNRRLGQRQSVKKCMTKREQGKGWGLVTTEAAKTGQLVQEYLGDVIDEKTKEERLNQWTKEHPNDPNYYIMCLSQGWYIDAREQSNLARFINHSCDPNCILLRFNVGGYMRNGIFALRDIKAGEFLSYDYHFDTKHGDKFVCRCGSANCRGTMKEKNVKNKDERKKTKAELWDQAKQQLEKDKQFLDELEARQSWNFKIQAVLPGTSNSKDPHRNPSNLSDAERALNGGSGSTAQKVEWVSSGVQDKDRNMAIRNRVFLWRNAVQGSDFAARWERSKMRKELQRKKEDVTCAPEAPVVVDVLSIVERNRINLS